MSDLEKLFAAAAEKLTKKEAAKQAKRDAAAGDFAAQAVSFESGFTLQLVFDYYRHVQKEPREILEARYAKLRGVPPPSESRHDWIAAATAYAYQFEYYRSCERDAPASVRKNASDQFISWHGAKNGETFDQRDPRWSDDPEIWDDTRIVAARSNPYQRGDAMRAFMAVELAGPDGVDFPSLCATLQEWLDVAVPAAQERAYGLFTDEVRAGNVKILIV